MRTNQQPLSGSTGETETLVSAFRQHEEIINRFIQLVESRAETKMLKTGKLEGAHYAAMKELQKAINQQTNNT